MDGAWENCGGKPLGGGAYIRASRGGEAGKAEGRKRGKESIIGKVSHLVRINNDPEAEKVGTRPVSGDNDGFAPERKSFPLAEPFLPTSTLRSDNRG